MTFEIGQRVKITGSEVELGEYYADRCAGMVGNLTEIKRNDPDEITHRVEFDDKYLGVWVKPEHLELIPDDGKQPTATPQPPVQYPPLRVMLTDNKPSQTWQQVLGSYPLAVSQPHLYLLGKYETMLSKTFRTFAQSNTRWLLMHIEDGTDSYSSEIHVFVITEGE